jgi:hypothetical protein
LRAVFLILLILKFANVHAQTNLIDSTSWRHGLQWIFGVGATKANFRASDPPSLDTLYLTNGTVPAGIISSGYSNICDTNGEFQFYTSGYFVFRKDGYPMHGLTYNNTPLGEKYAKKFYDLNDQISICLPKAGSTYYVISGAMSDAAFDEWEAGGFLRIKNRLDVLNYAVVDMAANDGYGAIQSRNTIIDRNKWFAVERMTAVRHGNGRDWWLVKPHKSKMQLYTYLVTANGISFWDSATHSADLTDSLGWRGQCTFSPDGAHFAMATDYGYFPHNMYTFDFDRCAGKFSNYHKLVVPVTEDGPPRDAVYSVCYSPDSKLLYAGAYEEIFQTESSDPTGAGFIRICGHDTTWGFPQYYNMGLGPDGKIYVGNFNGVRMQMSYIAQPNERGLACTFVPLGLRTKVSNLTSVPNMPHYGLGRWAGSPCDTVYKAPPPPPVPPACSFYPNPIGFDYGRTLNIALTDSTISAIDVRVCNMPGQVLSTASLVPNALHVAQLDMSQLPVGVYLVQVELPFAIGRQSKCVMKVVVED